MSIYYRLEIEYFGTDKNKVEVRETKNYLFETENAIENRKNVINEFDNFENTFKVANDDYGHIKLSIVEILGTNVDEFLVPTLNIYYSENKFSENEEGLVLYGSLLENLEERLTELDEERKLYEQKNIKVETEKIKDEDNNIYEILKESLIKETDAEKIKNVS